jgi:hypothetical protein
LQGAGDQVDQVRRSIENYHRVKDSLEKISDTNWELMRRRKQESKKARARKNEPCERESEIGRLAFLAALRMRESAVHAFFSPG